MPSSERMASSSASLSGRAAERVVELVEAQVAPEFVQGRACGTGRARTNWAANTLRRSATSNRHSASRLAAFGRALLTAG